MRKRQVNLIITVVFVLTLFAANLVYPKYFNLGVDFLNQKLPLGLPHFWEVPFKLRYNLKGGSWFFYEVNFSGEDKGLALEGLKDIIERRVGGFSERILIKAEEKRGHYYLIIELVGEDVPENINEAIELAPALEIREQRPEEETQKMLEKQQEVAGKTFEEIEKIEDWHLAFEDAYFKPTALTGEHLERVDALFDQVNLKPLVVLDFDEEGSKIFEDITSRNIGKSVAIYIDQSLVSAIGINEKITGGQAQISGNFSLDEAKRMAGNVEAVISFDSLKLISQKTVTPEQGKDTLRDLFRAGVVGVLGGGLLLLIMYRGFGVLTLFSLATYLILVGALFKLAPIDLSTFGVAGLIFSAGIFIGIHILIFSRIRRELEKKKSFSLARGLGFSESWPQLRDWCLAFLIIASVFLLEKPELVLDFVITSILGTLVALFWATLISQAFLQALEETKIKEWSWLWQ